MPTINWPEQSDEQLIDEAQAVRRGQGAVVEANRRLRNSIDALRESSDRWAVDHGLDHRPGYPYGASCLQEFCRLMAITLPIEIASRDLANLMGVMPRSVTDEQSTRYMQACMI